MAVSDQAVEIVKTLVKAHRASDREAMSMAQVAACVQNQQQSIRNGQRLNAQVDALWKAKCPDTYEPPEEDKDVPSTMINCTFNGDETLQQLSKIVGEVSSPGENEEPEPQPEQPSKPPQTGPPKGRWRRLTDFMLPLAAGAAITAGGFGMANYFNSDGDAYGLRALPYVPQNYATGDSP